MKRYNLHVDHDERTIEFRYSDHGAWVTAEAAEKEIERVGEETWRRAVRETQARMNVHYQRVLRERDESRRALAAASGGGA